MRHWKFQNAKQVEADLIRPLMEEALQLARKGAVLPAPSSKKVVLPPELKQVLYADREISKQFFNLTPGRQKEYAQYIARAKQDATKKRRLDKIRVLIAHGKGLNDKYR